GRELHRRRASCMSELAPVRRHPMKRLLACMTIASVWLMAVGPARIGSNSGATIVQAQARVEVSASVHHDVSRRLRDIPAAPRSRMLTERPLRPLPGEQAEAPVPDP